MRLPATELAVRDWLRTVDSVMALLGDDSRKVDVDYKGDPDATHLTLFRAGGAPERSVPLDRAVMQFHCWGRGRGAALNLATELASVLNTETEVFLNDDAYLRGAYVESVLWQPDPSGAARYIVIAVMTTSYRQAAA